MLDSGCTQHMRMWMAIVTSSLVTIAGAKSKELVQFLSQAIILWFGLKSELRTVRPWGADGPQANSNLY